MQCSGSALARSGALLIRTPILAIVHYRGPGSALHRFVLQCARDTSREVVLMTRNDAHPITVEVVRNAIVAYADEMRTHCPRPPTT